MRVVVENGKTLVYPEPISSQRVTYLISKGISPEIAAIDLEMVKLKLQDKEEGKGWSPEECDRAEVEYKRFLHLCKRYGRGIVPTQLMDIFWHYHILDTVAYHRDCEAVFGYYLHHYPYFGMRGEEDEKELESAFWRTAELYEAEFGEKIFELDSMKCWHDCQSRCWHACKSK